MSRAHAFLLAMLACAGPAHATDYLELTDFRLIDGSGAAERKVERLVARDRVIVAIDGTVAVGKVADLLVLEASPLADIHYRTSIRFVVRKGIVVSAQ